MSSRITRSRSKNLHVEGNAPAADDIPTIATEASIPVPKMKKDMPPTRVLPADTFSKALNKLSKDDLELLRLKQRRLRQPEAQVPTFIAASSQAGNDLLAQAAAATLVFAWKAAGTAICISPTGLLLTCSHCIAKSEDEYEPDKQRWLVFSSGDAMLANPVAFDSQRDLALLQITTICSTSVNAPPFPYARISPSAPRLRTHLLCIGHPGSEDLEASTAGIETGYDVLHISEGKFRGLEIGQDVQDNSDIGASKHDCWTYWGHSGAPLVDAKEGTLVGLHSSWDDETGMRRGVSWEAIREFLEEHCIVKEA